VKSLTLVAGTYGVGSMASTWPLSHSKLSSVLGDSPDGSSSIGSACLRRPSFSVTISSFIPSTSFLLAERGGGDRGASMTTLEQPSCRSTVASSSGCGCVVGITSIGGGGRRVAELPTHDSRRAAADDAADGTAVLVLRSRRRIARNILQ